MYEDLKLVDKDLVFDDIGSLVMIDGKESISQNIKNRLNTIKGDLFYNFNYGMDIDFKKLKGTNRYKDQLEAFIKQNLSNDKRISGILINSIEKISTDKFNIVMKIILTNNTVLNLEFIF